MKVQFMLDFDDNGSWAPHLSRALGGLPVDSLVDELVAASPRYVEDARALVFGETE